MAVGLSQSEQFVYERDTPFAADDAQDKLAHARMFLSEGSSGPE